MVPQDYYAGVSILHGRCGADSRGSVLSLRNSPGLVQVRGQTGQNDRATTLAQELLDLAHRYPNDWNYGNAIHHGHMVLGRVALAAGDVAKARAELLAAGQTPGSPQLNSFGPNMRLAQELLRVGEHDVVLEYFEHCRRFWSMGDKRLAEWIDDIARGRAPNFGPNLDY